MKVILLTDIAKVGRKHDVKDVSSGHATNFLIPQKLAVAATPEALKRLEMVKGKMEGEKKVQHELLVKNIKELDGKVVSISEKANAKGHLFAGLHREDIAKQIALATRIEIDPESVMVEHPIKEVGDHVIDIKLGGKTAKFTLQILSKEAVAAK